MAYCVVADLLTGEIPTPSYLVPTDFVTDAADEIDSYLGSLYITPLVLSEATPAERPWALLLKRVNAHLASGRLIMAAASGNQDKQVHAYAQYLIKAATDTLNKLQSGEIVIPFQTSATGTAYPTAPMINNLDEESNVEAFYDRIAKPGFFLPQVNL